jgi:hypothetical protein
MAHWRGDNGKGCVVAYDDEVDDEAYLDDSEEIGDDDLDVGGGDSETVPCPECGKPVYEQADRCPNCGNFIIAGNPTQRQPRWVLVVAILMIFVVLVVWALSRRP